MTRKNLLVTGASGFFGWALCNEARSAWNVFGVGNSHAITYEGVTAVTGDLTRPDAMQSLFGDVRPDAVIHAAAVASPGRCQGEPEESRIVNVELAGRIADLCADRAIPCVFTSTDQVFDGEHAPYRETDPVGPVCVYGEQKVEAEQVMLTRYPETAVCRLPLMFGYTQGATQTFYEQVARGLAEGNGLELITDEYRTLVDGESGARGVLLALERVHGVIHLGGRTSISRYDVGRLMERLMGVEPSILKGVCLNDINLPAPRARNISLDSARAYGLGYDPTDLEEAMRRALVLWGVLEAESL